MPLSDDTRHHLILPSVYKNRSSKLKLLQATLERDAYLKRLGILFTSSFCLLGGPIAYQTFDPFGQVLDVLSRPFHLPCCMLAELEVPQCSA